MLIRESSFHFPEGSEIRGGRQVYRSKITPRFYKDFVCTEVILSGAGKKKKRKKAHGLKIGAGSEGQLGSWVPRFSAGVSW